MTTKTKVIIAGAGFGGIAAAKRLAGCDADVTIIDRRNYHLFQPLLYQVATADLSPADIAWPIRGLFTRYRNIAVALSEVTAINPSAQEVVAGGRRYPYDYLILATGSGNSYFNHPEWEPDAPGLKRIIDAIEIRKRILLAFEQAEIADNPAAQRRLLNFVVIGGGPTGVEMAGAIAELAKVALARDFRHIDPKAARIVLVEAGQRLLASFPPALSQYAQSCLEQLGVEIALGQPVQAIDTQGVRIGETLLPTATVIWAAGVKVEGPGQWLGVETDRGGRVAVTADLSVPNHPNIFVIGDAAKVIWEGEKLVPGLAPAAKQQGRYVADVICARMENRTAPPPFRYRHVGSLATIGRNAAVVDFGRFKLKGWLAWWFWGLVHIYFLINARAATLVLLQWFWAYLTHKKGARLITGLRPLFSPPKR
ncbi:MAG: NAD(P)/FAD-dependent oxidoreductase [Candidatus Competibacter denitrificans]|jgi:NADH dehydrogenase|uniref:NADH:ubiquinone reductase (non-electrogenic) n=1 Tax=Candidatus Competibacter denitrificans Run_A_D11 TaxID=1400863 RepID=W6M9V3_9GAMM|nr:NAD(P)/FAD-dependent oxidoreductase [Candidatus Competibacter denitrificans]CDI04447.1 NADH dehydrogenase protein [Candidatus Competibacter denitrificans Run_A_D11]HAS85869.1 NAD(P)/FAD-dependent oxidoreductase [Candidatus Competibacteraceae bacterium]HRC69424.1 NAD(P)/FAD-dependent oxidoreductase [Candidatus Competibacter denitrificans]